MARIAACLVTRGDVPIMPIVQTIPEDWEIVIWDNSVEKDLAVYGRYAAINHTDAEIIYVQDDDCLTNPQLIADVYLEWHHEYPVVVANMPPQFRHDFYSDHCLVGFGAIFPRDLPTQAFGRFWDRLSRRGHGTWDLVDAFNREHEQFNRTCDIVFTTLTQRILVDVPHEDLPWASDANRMWKQPNHQTERSRTLELARKYR